MLLTVIIAGACPDPSPSLRA